MNQLLAVTVLRRYGHRVDTVANGVEAVEAAVRFPYDLILMDVHMPEMDGIEATARIRRIAGERGRVPIIAVTANAMEGDRQRFLAAGMDEYLAKPIDMAKLVELVGKLAIDGAAPALDIAVIERLEQRLGLDVVQRLAADWLSKAPDRARDLRLAVHEGNRTNLEHEAKELFDSAGNLGLYEVQAIASNIGQAFHDNRTDSALGQVANLAAALDRALAALGRRYPPPLAGGG